MAERIYLSPPDLSGNEVQYIQEAMASNWIAPFGPMLETFKNKLKIITGSAFVEPVNSGTSAIHLALLALNIQEGDVVFCPTFTFAASVFPVLYQKATPVFIDSETDSWNMDPDLLEQAIRDAIDQQLKIKAIILVHIYGFPAQVQRIKQIAQTFNLYIIEDAAESLGTTVDGKHTGTFGSIGILSFNGNKIITGGNGGAVLTDDSILSEKISKLSNQAKEDKPFYEHLEIGYNYRMCNINAAIALGQVEQLHEKITKKKQIRLWYKQYLQGFAQVKTVPHADDNAWLTCVELPSAVSPESIIQSLEKEHIESRRVWNPMHQQPVFKGYQAYINGNSDSFFATGVCLPSGTKLLEKDIIHITDIMKCSL